MGQGRMVAEHFNQNGKPKRGFPNMEAAKKFLSRQGWTGLYRSYECSFCGKWHIASKKGVAKKNLTRRFS